MDALSTRDFIKNSIINSSVFQDTLTWESLIGIGVSLGLAFVMGFIIFGVYKKTYRGVVYSQTFSVTLVGMTVLTCMVTLAISTNIVLSLGMVGALSIVRYRTAVKEPYDLMFLFWAITTGITLGAKMYILAFVSAVVVALLVFFLKSRARSGQVYIIVIHYGSDKTGDEIRRIMKGKKHKVRSKTMRKNHIEMAVEVHVTAENFAFAEQIRSLEDVNDLTMVQYDGEFNI